MSMSISRVKKVTMQIDAGASVTLVSKVVYKESLAQLPVEISSMKLFTSLEKTYCY